MIGIIIDDNKTIYSVIDTSTEISLFPVRCSIGSSAFVIETSEHYILNGSKQWVKINP